MAKPKIEPFPEYQPRGGAPMLRSWTSRKTVSVEWSDGSVRDYGGFARAVNCEAMGAELRGIFERHRPQFVKNAKISIGSGVNGYMLCVPPAAGREAMAVVRKYFAEVLGSEHVAGAGIN